MKPNWFPALLIASVLVSALPLPAQATGCPLGPKDKVLTLQRIMINLGKFILPAESVAIKGKQWPQSVTDDEIQKAITGLDAVLACSEAALQFPADGSVNQLFPRTAKELEGEARAGFLKAYTGRMTVFALEVGRFKTLFERLLELPPESRSFEEIHEKFVRINQHTDASHKALSCWESLK